MPLFRATERRQAEKLTRLIVANPFLPEWIEREADFLGVPLPSPRAYSWHPGWGLWGADSDPASHGIIAHAIDTLVERGRERLSASTATRDHDLALYQDLAYYSLYSEHGEALDRIIDATARSQPAPDVGRLWDEFEPSYARLLPPGFFAHLRQHGADHLFACFFALRRAFYYIFHALVGTSRAAMQLRGSIWQSLFTHDIKAWSRSLTATVKDFPTLISGPHGTGKELVARAIGRAQFIPFLPRQRRFAADFTTIFHPLHLAALPATLVESELFGHKKGSFSGAVQDREGILEACSPCGSVFLDEIGELPAEIQVKLLRVLQTRTFQRIGDNAPRTFQGKILAATNRDLAAEVQAGRFREDFYYRLCADRITTPSLREQLADRPEDLRVMVEFICRGVVGEDEANPLAKQVVGWIDEHLGREYAWPGNFRELEQCVRSYTIRKEYHPLQSVAVVGDPRQTLADDVLHGRLTATQLERRYATLVFAQTGSYQEAARVLGCDWRTLRGKIDRDYLRTLQRLK